MIRRTMQVLILLSLTGGALFGQTIHEGIGRFDNTVLNALSIPRSRENCRKGQRPSETGKAGTKENHDPVSQRNLRNNISSR